MWAPRKENVVQDYLASDPLPTCDANESFTTEFTPFLSLPGFFPGAGGFFHGYPDPTKKVLIFGTDFGPLGYQQELGSQGGEPASNPTIANLVKVLRTANVSLKDCFLTNAVLCMWRTDSTVGNHGEWRKHPNYIEQCAAWHRRFVQNVKPRGVVLMGAPALETTGKALFPGLAKHWAGLTTLKQVYAAGKETYSIPSGPTVLLMPHTSYWPVNGRHLGPTAIKHLSLMA